MRAAILIAIATAVLAVSCNEQQSSKPSDAPAGSASASASASSSAAPAASGSGSAAAAVTSAVPLTPEQERAAQADVANDCLPCHTDEMLNQQRLTVKQWGNVVKKMQGWGSKLDAPAAERVVSYLSARYKLDAPPYAVPTIDAAAAAEMFADQPDGPFAKGDTKKGEALYKEACALCHAENARGTDKGVILADRLILSRARDFAAIIRAGRGRMPAFATQKDEDIGNILAYLRTIRPN